MTRSWYLIGALGLLALTSVGGAYLVEAPEQPSPGAQIILEHETLHVLLAMTDAERRKGLGGIDSLGAYDGMLFVLENDRGGIWMKGMRFALDILWIAEDGTVLAIEENIAPTDMRIFTHVPSSRYVLEVSAGFAAEHKIEEGSKVTL